MYLTRLNLVVSRDLKIPVVLVDDVNSCFLVTLSENNIFRAAGISFITVMSSPIISALSVQIDNEDGVVDMAITFPVTSGLNQGEAAR